MVVSVLSEVLYRGPKFALLKLFKLDWRVDVLTLVRSELLWSISEGTKELVPIDVTPHIARHLRIFRELMQDCLGLEFVDNTQS